MKDSLILQKSKKTGDTDSSFFAMFALSCDHHALWKCAKEIGLKRGVAPAAPAAPAVTTLFGISAVRAMFNQPVEFQLKCAFQRLKEMLHCLC